MKEAFRLSSLKTEKLLAYWKHSGIENAILRFICRSPARKYPRTAFVHLCEQFIIISCKISLYANDTASIIFKMCQVLTKQL